MVLDCFIEIELFGALLEQNLVPKVISLLTFAKNQVQHIDHELLDAEIHVPGDPLALQFVDCLLGVL